MSEPTFEEEIEQIWQQSSQPASPAETAERLANDEARQTAIVHLHFLMQYSTGAATPQTLNDPARRYDAVLSFLMTGRCLPDAETRPLVKAIHSALIASLDSPQ